MITIDLCDYTKILNKKEVLKNINLHFESGKIYKLEGPNGGGKTMLLRALAGLIYPTSGEMCINGQRITSKSKYPVTVGALIENPAFWPEYTGKEILKYLADIKKEIGEKEICDTMEKLGLDPNDKRKIGKYSLGMRKKLGIAQAIMEKPDIVLLDEPVNALDKKSIQKLVDVINLEKQRDAIVVIAMHNAGEFVVDVDEEIWIEEGEVSDD